MLLELENATDPLLCVEKVYIRDPSSFKLYLHSMHTDQWGNAGTGEEGRFTDPTARDKLCIGGSGGNEEG